MSRDEYRPCPACPDGGVWTSEGPTGKLCPVCKGHAVVNLDGSPIKPAESLKGFPPHPNDSRGDVL
jgi:hypothetical protein